MFYTYVIQSEATPTQRYIGHTTDLRKRLDKHNSGKCPHTSKYAPWKIRLYLAFQTLALARDFEQYLKSGSGHAFAHRHFGT